ncbi:GNAT family N-acetyltransferase [Actinopolymorpha alba]|uniref:GNAT family N-acetyltransferase n=1 Tax=Actinopolymorpha alba TaxID=533267 RepID=UPI00035FD957|nr:GNAT family N-acetyltransferase [Actinopolymorpha alba]
MLDLMRCEATADPNEFWDATSDFLLSDPFRNSVTITNVVARRTGAVTDPKPATYLIVRDSAGAVVGTAMRTPPHAVVLSPMPAAAVEAAVEALLPLCPDAAGVNATVAEASAFASAWTRRSGGSTNVGMHLRIHRLDAVDPPAQVAGSMRVAGEADRDLLTAWTEAFTVEAEGGGPSSEDTDQAAEANEEARHNVDLRLAEHRAWIWDAAGPVSYAGTSVCVAGVVRIGPVYTPPAARGKGYASALVAAVSQAALDAGAVACTLYTDVGNPTSNKIYAAVGYRPVCDVTSYRFQSDGS